MSERKSRTTSRRKIHPSSRSSSRESYTPPSDSQSSTPSQMSNYPQSLSHSGSSRSPTPRGSSRSPTHRVYSRSPTPRGSSRSPTHPGYSRSPTHREFSRSPNCPTLSSRSYHSSDMYVDKLRQATFSEQSQSMQRRSSPERRHSYQLRQLSTERGLRESLHDASANMRYAKSQDMTTSTYYQAGPSNRSAIYLAPPETSQETHSFRHSSDTRTSPRMQTRSCTKAMSASSSQDMTSEPGQISKSTSFIPQSFEIPKPEESNAPLHSSNPNIRRRNPQKDESRSRKSTDPNKARQGTKHETQVKPRKDMSDRRGTTPTASESSRFSERQVVVRVDDVDSGRVVYQVQGNDLQIQGNDLQIQGNDLQIQGNDLQIQRGSMQGPPIQRVPLRPLLFQGPFDRDRINLILIAVAISIFLVAYLLLYALDILHKGWLDILLKGWLNILLKIWRSIWR